MNDDPYVSPAQIERDVLWQEAIESARTVQNLPAGTEISVCVRNGDLSTTTTIRVGTKHAYAQ